MTNIYSFHQFVDEIKIPLSYTAMMSSVISPAIGIGLRETLVRSNLLHHLRGVPADLPWNVRSGEHLVQKVFNFMGLMRWEFGAVKGPILTPGLHDFVKGLRRVPGPGLATALEDFSLRAAAWTYQVTPCSLWMGGIVGFLIPFIAGKKSYLREEKFDWPPRVLLVLACTLSGGVLTFLSHQSASRLTGSFIRRGKVFRTGFVIPYLVLPVLVSVGLFIWHQLKVEIIANLPEPIPQH